MHGWREEWTGDGSMVDMTSSNPFLRARSAFSSGVFLLGIVRARAAGSKEEMSA